MVTYTGGRPLSLEVDPADGDRLFVAEPSMGLCSVEISTGRVTVLANTDPAGRPLRYVNNVAVNAADGALYFSDSGHIGPVRLKCMCARFCVCRASASD